MKRQNLAVLPLFVSCLLTASACLLGGAALRNALFALITAVEIDAAENDQKHQRHNQQDTDADDDLFADPIHKVLALCCPVELLGVFQAALGF